MPFRVVGKMWARPLDPWALPPTSPNARPCCTSLVLQKNIPMVCGRLFRDGGATPFKRGRGMGVSRAWLGEDGEEDDDDDDDESQGELRRRRLLRGAAAAGN